MRLRIGFALLSALVLISGASWLRHSSQTTSPTLTSVEGSASPVALSDQIPTNTADLAVATNTSTNTATNLTTTDLVGRQLIMEYVNLASAGAATQENLDSLANKYVDNIPTINQVKTADLVDLRLVPNTKANLQNYSDLMTDYLNGLQHDINKNNSSGDLDTLGRNLRLMTEGLSNTYQKVAEKLMVMQVPLVLSSAHLKLVNNFLSISSAMKTLSQVQGDSVSAYAGLTAVGPSFSEEQTIIGEINAILEKNDL